MNAKLRCPDSGHHKVYNLHFREIYRLDLPKKENQTL